ncbi:MAG: hypothetical protein Q7R41_17120, partial [Phycisphaerales bacterium]|nr:hypothetical protein [Phycisphaerales bacterium]
MSGNEARLATKGRVEGIMGDERGDRSALVRDVAGRLAKVDDLVLEPTNQFHPWRNMLHGLVGALYSLKLAIPVLSGATRLFEHTVREARAVIESIRSSQELAAQDAKLWYVGHFLNNAEFRIASILHQVLKAGYPCKDFERVTVPGLAKGIADSRLCPKCGIAPIAPGRASWKTVTAICNKDPTCSLFLVHSWTHGLKLERVPDVDKLEPTTRWDTDLSALS